ncbi:MAG TPA: ROK family protein, partial [Flavitalea sp.]|nr:ROK family protein [Flavitalea sp.]
MKQSRVIGIDLGATNVRGSVVTDNGIQLIHSARIRSSGTQEEVLEDLYALTDSIMEDGIAGIGIGVPSVVDIEAGIVYDVQYIPSWKEVPLKALMESRYNVPVYVNNDANCFALGEYYFGKGKGHRDMIGLAVGTGIGAGIIINRHLYAGANCGAGEFGMVDYLDHCYEYYAAGQAFQNVYGADGQQVFELAKQSDPQAVQWYEELGTHLGNCIKTIMYTYDPALIVMGGSVRHAYPFFQQTMWERIRSFAFTKSIGRLKIELSELENSGILGAAGLYFDS